MMPTLPSGNCEESKQELLSPTGSFLLNQKRATVTDANLVSYQNSRGTKRYNSIGQYSFGNAPRESQSS